MIYFFCFGGSIILMGEAEVREKLASKENTYVKYVIMSALILVLLAAFRDVSVGHDVMVYQIRYLEVANKFNSFYSYYRNFCLVAEVEPLYGFITYIARILGGGKSTLFFLNETVILIFIYKAIWNYRLYISPTVSLSLFLFFYYLRGYDQTRQFMAASVLLYAFTLFDKEKYKLSILFILIGIGLHSSAIIGYGLLALFLMIKSQLSTLYKIIILVVLLILSSNFYNIVYWMISNIDVIPDRYLTIMRASKNVQVDFAGAAFAVIVFALFILIVLLLFGHVEYIHNYDYMLYMMLFAFVGCTVQTYFSSQVSRIFIYPEMYSIFVLPMFPRLFNNNISNKIVINGVLFIFMISYFISVFVIGNAGEVYPYVFSIK